MKFVLLAGGVGGAKLADGISGILPPEECTIIVNTGDDFYHYGLRLCTDLDTVCYTLAGIANPQTGWGRADETWRVLENLHRLDAPDWFRLGDADLATHLERTRLLHLGVPLSEITRRFCERWGIRHTILPMTDMEVSTHVRTRDGRLLDFQDYFVRDGFQPAVEKVVFSGSDAATPAPGVLEAIRASDVVLICPSNPLLSIDPILSVPGIADAVRSRPVVGVSPIIGGKAVKGPLAKMVSEMYDTAPSAQWVAEYYRQTCKLDGFILDEVDRACMDKLTGQGIICMASQTFMQTTADRLHLAEIVLSFCQTHFGRVVLS
mgnify:CR=1 FL=1